jgi:hypothetical protein
MLTSEDIKINPRRRNHWRRRWIERRRKERGRLIFAVLEHLYGIEQARSMWSAYLRSKQGNDHLGLVS